MDTSHIELMVPAGSFPALAAAIRSGAHSIYFGVEKLNMRARAAQPFTTKDLRRVARICRWCGVRSYLALNIIMYDEDLDTMREVCREAKEQRITAIIASDIVTMEYARKLDIEVHISVQANVSNVETLKFYARYADVVVLARELTLEQIRYICDEIHHQDIRGPSGKLVKIEIFAHGALCVAVSGLCGMSLATYNKSANRGSCYQPCRRPYRVTDIQTNEEFVLDNKYIMSPRDLCTIQMLDKLIGAGISVLKLEGRGRTANYVRVVTKAYKEALLSLADGTYTSELGEQWMTELEKVFNRDFWHGGYYCGKKLGEWSGIDNSQATHKRHQLGRITNYFAKLQVAQFPLWLPSLKVGEELLIEGPTTGALTEHIREMRVNGEPVQNAVQGDTVTVPVRKRVRKNDKVFALRPVSDTG